MCCREDKAPVDDLVYRYASAYMSSFATWKYHEQLFGLREYWLPIGTNVGISYQYPHYTTSNVPISSVAAAGYEMGLGIPPDSKIIHVPLTWNGIQQRKCIEWTSPTGEFSIDGELHTLYDEWSIDDLKLGGYPFPSSFYGTLSNSKDYKSKRIGVEVGRWCSHSVIDHFMEIFAVLHERLQLRGGTWPILRDYLYGKPNF